MSGFSVDPDQLERFAGTSDGRAGDLTQLRSTMDDIRVSPDGFGHIPFLGSQVYDAYDEHVAACEDAVTEASEVMTAVSTGIRAVVEAYLEGDRALGEDTAALEQALGGAGFLEGTS